MNEEMIAVQADFDLHAYWEKVREEFEERVPPFALTLHVALEARSRIEGDFTVLREQPDGSALIQVHLESAASAIAYALALGTDARVISPIEVRDTIVATVRAIEEMYQQ